MNLEFTLSGGKYAGEKVKIKVKKENKSFSNNSKYPKLEFKTPEGEILELRSKEVIKLAEILKKKIDLDELLE